jgi:hypothetical protein
MYFNIVVLIFRTNWMAIHKLSNVFTKKITQLTDVPYTSNIKNNTLLIQALEETQMLPTYEFASLDIFIYFLWHCSPARAMTTSSRPNDAPQSVGLLWTSDQFVAQTSAWQHTTHTTDKNPCPRSVSNPRSQQANGRRPRGHRDRHIYRMYSNIPIIETRHILKVLWISGY